MREAALFAAMIAAVTVVVAVTMTATCPDGTRPITIGGPGGIVIGERCR